MPTTNSLSSLVSEMGFGSNKSKVVPYNDKTSKDNTPGKKKDEMEPTDQSSLERLEQHGKSTSNSDPIQNRLSQIESEFVNDTTNREEVPMDTDEDDIIDSSVSGTCGSSGSDSASSLSSSMVSSSSDESDEEENIPFSEEQLHWTSKEKKVKLISSKPPPRSSDMSKQQSIEGTTWKSNAIQLEVQGRNQEELSHKSRIEEAKKAIEKIRKEQEGTKCNLESDETYSKTQLISEPKK
jgi:hypothetical protein